MELNKLKGFKAIEKKELLKVEGGSIANNPIVVSFKFFYKLFN